MMPEVNWKDRYEKLQKKVKEHEETIRKRDEEIAALKTVISRSLNKPVDEIGKKRTPVEKTDPAGRVSLFSREDIIEERRIRARSGVTLYAKDDDEGPLLETGKPGRHTDLSALAKRKLDEMKRASAAIMGESEGSREDELSARGFVMEPVLIDESELLSDETFLGEGSLFDLPEEPSEAPCVWSPDHYKPGMFLSAVIDGESEGERMLDLLTQLESGNDNDRLHVVEEMEELYPLMVDTMIRRMDPASLSWEKRLFIRYGMLDERLMVDQMDLWEALFSDSSSPEDTGIYHVDEWFDSILAGEHTFSYPDKKSLHGEHPDRNATGEKAINYELKNVLRMHDMCIDPHGIKKSILMQEFCSHGPDSAVINRSWLRESLEYIQKCDSLLWHRRYKEKDIEVDPIFIILPGYGDTGICWEPYAPGEKGTSGPRIAICSFPDGSSMRALSRGLADYRWEYAKADARQYWMAEGLTGDWLSVFNEEERKQNVKLIFLEGYVLWVMKESHGTPTLQRRFREFMWYNVPFSDEIKEELKDCAAFENLMNGE